MKSTHWFPSLAALLASGRTGKVKRRSYRPRLESLEDRRTPTVVPLVGEAEEERHTEELGEEQLPIKDDVVVVAVEEQTEVTDDMVKRGESVDEVADGEDVIMVTLMSTTGVAEEEVGAEETAGEDTAEENPTPEVVEDVVPETEEDTTEEVNPEIFMTMTPTKTTTPVRRTVTTTSTRQVVVPPPASLQIDLQAASDLGVSNSDNVTNQTTVVFDVTVNQAGSFRIDYTGDGVFDYRQHLKNAGTYAITVTGLQEGTRTVKARLLPEAAVAQVTTTTQLTIDTTGPRLLNNPSGQLPPIGSRSLKFSEALDPATIGMDKVTVVLPDASNASVTSVLGSGANYQVNFGASSAMGQYEVRVSPEVRDLAGNKMDQDRDGQKGEATDDVGVDRFFTNNAPTLDNTGVMQLRALRKNAVSTLGLSVKKLLASAGGDRITDTDVGAKEGIAVIGVDDAQGTWQYSTDFGASWQNFSVVSSSASRLLNANRRNRIRFVPAQDFVGTVDPGLTFRAWDRTEGVNGGTFAINEPGGSSAFSLATETVRVEVLGDAVV